MFTGLSGNHAICVEMKVDGKSQYAVVDAEDALIAALKVKIEQPDAEILYVGRANNRGECAAGDTAKKTQGR